MPRPPARLANCYVPVSLREEGKQQSSLIPVTPANVTTLRGDRKYHELRQLCLEMGVLANRAIGSSMVELGHTKVLCQVSMNVSHPNTIPERGILDCKVQFAPHIGIDASTQRAQAVMPLDSMLSTGKLHSETMSRESSLSAQLHSSLVSVLKLQDFPKCALEVHATILQDDGSVLTTCITAASLALADARVEMLDMVASCTVAVFEADPGDVKDQSSMDVENEASREPIFLADPTEAEQIRASTIICLAMTPNLKEVTLWSQSGRLDVSHSSQAIEICRSGCRTMHKLMREVWISKLQQ